MCYQSAQQPKLYTLYDHRVRKCRLYTTTLHVLLYPSFHSYQHPSHKIFAIGNFTFFPLIFLSLSLSLFFKHSLSLYFHFSKKMLKRLFCLTSWLLKVEGKSLLSQRDYFFSSSFGNKSLFIWCVCVFIKIIF